MRTDQPRDKLTRREMLRLSAAGRTALQGTALLAPVVTHTAASSPATAESQLYSTLLKTWCDVLIARQSVAMRDPGLYGSLLCPACALIHGRCGRTKNFNDFMPQDSRRRAGIATFLKLTEIKGHQVFRVDTLGTN